LLLPWLFGLSPELLELSCELQIPPCVNFLPRFLLYTVMVSPCAEVFSLLEYGLGRQIPVHLAWLVYPGVVQGSRDYSLDSQDARR
jgi:hypothetical protein